MKNVLILTQAQRQYLALHGRVDFPNGWSIVARAARKYAAVRTSGVPGSMVTFQGTQTECLREIAKHRA